MLVTPGSRLGSYEIVSALGAGGMGEVYRARDSRLQRDVAIKILPEAFAADPERLARFEREAQVLAALNHPHIAQIYGLEEQALVMELVDGETLADRLARGALPVDEALALARQIADGLEAAHGRGIVHRDLKPANIKVTSAGVVKILDFGLAKLTVPEQSVAAPGALALSPTITSPALATGVGVLLGTAAYMSPEQAKGLPADHRSDVFAFGDVLFEMLAGRQAFAGDTVSDVLASVLAREPQFDVLPKTLDPRILEVLCRCLVKSVRQRWQAIGDVRIELERIASSPRETVAIPVANRKRRVAGVGALIVAAALLGGSAAMYWRPQANTPETRLDVTTGDTYQFGGVGSYALSPDGRALVFAASVRDGVSQLWLRRLARPEATPLPGTERGTVPFWSPDGRSVAFFSDATLKRIDLVDQTTQTLATLNYGTGGAWAPDGSILFSPSISAGLMVLQPGNSKPVPVKAQQRAQQAPQFLPDGQQFLFFVSSPADARGVYVGDRQGGSVRKLLDADGPAQYVDAGWILFLRRGTLFARRFDPTRAVVSGDPVVVAQGVASFSAARAGVIAYRAGASRAEGAADFGRLQWVDRDGKERSDLTSPVGTGTNPVIASDGRITLDRLIDGNRDVWVFDGTRATRLTSDDGVDFVPQWMPSGNRVVFSSNRRRALDLYEVPVDDPAAVRPIFESDRDKLAVDVSPDGRAIAFLQISDDGGQDIWTVRTDDAKSAAPFIATRSDERGAQFSPDGRWIAYQSDESGRYEIYVRRFPAQSGGGRQLVSTAGGIWPRWSHDGRELYYVEPAGALMAAPIVASGDALNVAVPATLFKGEFRTLDPRIHAQYDVDRNGRFLVVTERRGEPAPPITIILNWSPSGT